MTGQDITQHPVTDDPDIPEQRRLSTIGFVVLVAVYLLIVQGVGWLSTKYLVDESVGYADFPNTEAVLYSLVVPVGTSVVFVAAVITWLGWWPNVLHDHRPVNKWVRIVPAIIAAVILAGTYWAGLFDQSAGYIAMLIVGVLCVGFAEEGVFRGIGLTAFRQNGFRERHVAIWTSVLFGAAHATNIFDAGASALFQAGVTMVAGFFFYLILRVSGSLIVPMLLHAAWDFGLFTGGLWPEDSDIEVYPGSGLFMLTNLVLLVVLVIRRKKIGIEQAAVYDPSHS